MPFIEYISTYWDLIGFFFLISVLYASVGFGGGSSYLAVLALTSLAYTEVRAMALICNIVVVSNASYLQYRNNNYDFRKVLPLIIVSVPMAFIGGYLKIEETFFYILLGSTLLLASLFMLRTKREQNISSQNKGNNRNAFLLKNLSYGGVIGFISGMVGIGGGIFLAPLLHLTKWDSSKKIAATASLFILVNSISGLTGQVLNPKLSLNIELTLLLAMTVFIGGQIGTRAGIYFIKPLVLKKATAILIAFVAIRILWKHLL